MYKKSKKSILLIGALLTLFFSSCSNDDALSNIPNEQEQAAKSARLARALPNLHTLTITNLSDYNYLIHLVGAQPSFDLAENLIIFHKNTPPMIVPPGYRLIFYDYTNASAPQYVITHWDVYDHLTSSDVGTFTSVKMSELFGILTQPNNPQSARYPVWKWIEGAVTTSSNELLEPYTGNMPTAELSSLGNAEQGYNSVLKYGPAGSSLTANPMVEVRWHKPNGSVRNNSEVRVTIKNISRQ